jgi:hypothetical protein
MNRKETTAFLGKLLETDRLSGMGKYWAREVSIDPWTSKGKPKRVDYMQFVPDNQCSISAIEKGIFICYEIKSCKEDVYSGNGLNFLGERNYIVTTMECYKDLVPDMKYGRKFWKHLEKASPDSSSHVGIMVAIPNTADLLDELENPTPLDDGCDFRDWTLATVMHCRIGPRKRSMTELLFCMLRSGR